MATLKQQRLFPKMNVQDETIPGTRQGGYKAIESTGARPAPLRTVRHEDRNLRNRQRIMLQATARDMERNFVLAAWVVRKHLDFVASHYFSARTDDQAFNRELEAFVDYLAEPEQFDLRGRHNLREGLRLMEQGRVLDGDMFSIKINSGHVQFIEADRVQNPPHDRRRRDEEWLNGALVDGRGRVKRWSVYRRAGGASYTYERMIKVENMFQVGYFNRFDQIRGISPMASGLNMFRDVYDNIGYALAKSKVAQMFGLKFTRDNPNAIGQPVQTGSHDDMADEDVIGRYPVSFGRGPVILDLFQGDDANFLENKTPATEFQAFMQSTISLSMKSLDLPFNFFDESFTNFFGSKAAFILYSKSVVVKQRQLRNWLDRWFRWRMNLAIANGEFTLPGGMAVEDLRYDWLPDGTPWWDPKQEIEADIMARNAGFKTLDEIIRQRSGPGVNGDWRAKVDQIAIENEYMDERGVTLSELTQTVETPVVEDIPDEQDDDESET